jgi:hypothetical protein
MVQVQCRYFLTFYSRDHRDTKQEISMRMSRKEERKKEKKLAKDYINAVLRTALIIKDSRVKYLLSNTFF